MFAVVACTTPYDPQPLSDGTPVFARPELVGKPMLKIRVVVCESVLLEEDAFEAIARPLADMIIEAATEALAIPCFPDLPQIVHRQHADFENGIGAPKKQLLSSSGPFVEDATLLLPFLAEGIVAELRRERRIEYDGVSKEEAIQERWSKERKQQ